MAEANRRDQVRNQQLEFQSRAPLPELPAVCHKQSLPAERQLVSARDHPSCIEEAAGLH